MQLSLQLMAVSWHSVKRFERGEMPRMELMGGEGTEPTVTVVETKPSCGMPLEQRWKSEVVSLRMSKRVTMEEQEIDEAKISETATKVRYLRNDRCPSRTLARTNGEPHLPVDALPTSGGD